MPNLLSKSLAANLKGSDTTYLIQDNTDHRATLAQLKAYITAGLAGGGGSFEVIDYNPADHLEQMPVTVTPTTEGALWENGQLSVNPAGEPTFWTTSAGGVSKNFPYVAIKLERPLTGEIVLPPHHTNNFIGVIGIPSEINLNSHLASITGGLPTNQAPHRLYSNFALLGLDMGATGLISAISSTKRPDGTYDVSADANMMDAASPLTVTFLDYIGYAVLMGANPDEITDEVREEFKDLYVVVVKATVDGVPNSLVALAAADKACTDLYIMLGANPELMGMGQIAGMYPEAIAIDLSQISSQRNVLPEDAHDGQFLKILSPVNLLGHNLKANDFLGLYDAATQGLPIHTAITDNTAVIQALQADVTTLKNTGKCRGTFSTRNAFENLKSTTTFKNGDYCFFTDDIAGLSYLAMYSSTISSVGEKWRYTLLNDNPDNPSAAPDYYILADNLPPVMYVSGFNDADNHYPLNLDLISPRLGNIPSDSYAPGYMYDLLPDEFTVLWSPGNNSTSFNILGCQLDSYDYGASKGYLGELYPTINIPSNHHFSFCVFILKKKLTSDGSVTYAYSKPKDITLIQGTSDTSLRDALTSRLLNATFKVDYGSLLSPQIEGGNAAYSRNIKQLPLKLTSNAQYKEGIENSDYAIGYTYQSDLSRFTASCPDNEIWSCMISDRFNDAIPPASMQMAEGALPLSYLTGNMPRRTLPCAFWVHPNTENFKLDKSLSYVQNDQVSFYYKAVGASFALDAAGYYKLYLNEGTMYVTTINVRDGLPTGTDGDGRAWVGVMPEAAIKVTMTTSKLPNGNRPRCITINRVW